MKHKQYMLMILDGVGLNDKIEGNAFLQAKTPNIDKLLNDFPNAKLATSGLAVGLPEGQMGNSEVGHANIGAGRIIYQDFTRIAKSISDGSFIENQALAGAMKSAKSKGSALHLMGLVSDGGVHSHQKHLYALLEMAKKIGVKKVFVHVFTDGRDTAPTSAIKYVKKLNQEIARIGIGQISSISGRFYAMDRDNRWDRTKLAYDSIVSGSGDKFEDVEKFINESYSRDINDEFIIPTSAKDYSGVNEGDSIIFFNFRLDRSRQLTRAIADEDFKGFNRANNSGDFYFVSMTEYDSTISNVEVAFGPQNIENTFGEYISSLGKTQLRIAETEKYAHVTFYFNGGREDKYNKEDRVMVPSPKIETYDLKPEMSAYELTDGVMSAIKSEKYDVIVLNYANGDMVGHTGKIDKTIKAVEALDDCVGKISKELLSRDGELMIIADHGNCEYMLDENDEIVTSHSIFDVPCIVVSERVSKVVNGSLCDVAPTMLTLMGEPIPDEMSGKNLIEF